MRLLCMLTFSGPASWPQLLQPGDGRISGGAAATLCGRNRSDRLATSGLKAAAAVRLERLKLGQLRLEGPNGLGFLQQQADGGETAPGLLELGNTDFHPGKVYPLLEKLKNTNNYCGLESSVGPVHCAVLWIFRNGSELFYPDPNPDFCIQIWIRTVLEWTK